MFKFLRWGSIIIIDRCNHTRILILAVIIVITFLRWWFDLSYLFNRISTSCMLFNAKIWFIGQCWIVITIFSMLHRSFFHHSFIPATTTRTGSNKLSSNTNYTMTCTSFHNQSPHLQNSHRHTHTYSHLLTTSDYIKQSNQSCFLKQKTWEWRRIKLEKKSVNCNLKTLKLLAGLDFNCESTVRKDKKKLYRQRIYKNIHLYRQRMHKNIKNLELESKVYFDNIPSIN